MLNLLKLTFFATPCINYSIRDAIGRGSNDPGVGEMIQPKLLCKCYPRGWCGFSGSKERDFWTYFVPISRSNFGSAFECFRRGCCGILGVFFRPLLKAFLLLCSTLVRLISDLFCQTLISRLAWLFRAAMDTQFRGHFWCYALEFLLCFWTLSSGLARLFKGLSSYIASWPRPCYV